MKLVMNNEIEDFKNLLPDRILGYHRYSNMVHNREYLNILIYCKYWTVRCSVAKQGYGHYILQYDKDANVRWDVAKYAKDKVILQYLLNDKDKSISNEAKLRLKEYRYG